MWDEFENIVAEITEAVSTHVKLPAPPTDPPGAGSGRQIDPQDPTAIQRLYRRNRRQAIRIIGEDSSPRCSIDAAVLENHFRGSLAAKPCRLEIYNDTQPAPLEVNCAPFTRREVLLKLKSCENTAPGSDRLTYNHWKSADPDAQCLTALFNICLHSSRIPSCWKSARTVLIHKSGDPEDVGNWRPISLLPTAYKLLTGCLARRLVAWIQMHNVLSPSQKGFMPADGVFEHNYLLQHEMRQARGSAKDLCIGSLDFSNAFGAIQHQALLRALSSAGAGSPFVNLIRDAYSGASTTILSESGATQPIAVEAGVRQGDPISGLLFDIAIDPILRRVQVCEAAFPARGVLAYADDLLLLESSPALLQLKIDAVARMATSIGISLNANKCFSLHLSGRVPRGTRASVFTVEGINMRALGDGESGLFLGKPIGFNAIREAQSLDPALRLAERILSSMLAPWQRIDALKTFLFPSLNFAMRTNQLPKKEWKKLDELIRPAVKKTLYLPPEASNGYIYGDAESGAFALPLAAEDSDIALIDSAFKLLSSRDSTIADIAWRDLEDGVTKRLRRPTNHEDLQQFLSASQEGEYAASSNAGSSVWTAARAASGRLCVKWVISDDRTASIALTLSDGTLGPSKRRQVCKGIRRELRQCRSLQLESLPQQGKAMECVATSKASSHFFREGRYTRFADWRFIHRARLGLVPLNGTRRWDQNHQQNCRRCNFPQETLPHVLNHCMRYSALYQKRHNAIVDRVRNAAAGRFGILSENQLILNTNLKPDLVLTKGNSAVIIDITIPFENRMTAFQRARQEKISKYAPVAAVLGQQFADVSVEAFIVGSLGSWDPANEQLLSRLCSKKYGALMRKLCVSDTIRWSRDIYVEHLTGKRQAPET